MNKYKFLIFTFALLAFCSTASAATLTLSPSSGTYASGSTFTINVLLNTTGASIDGVDVRYLRFNPSVLQVVDSNSSASGVQINPGSLMPITLTNTVDNQNGLVTFSQIVAGGQHYQGSGTLLSITFRAVNGGTASLSFDAASGVTTDTNVASAGTDVLSPPSGATFSISGVITPTPTPTPTPTGTGAGAGAGGGGAVTPTPTSTTTPTPTGTIIPPPILTRTIYFGSKGADVLSLQNYLIATGYLNVGSNSGFFGNLTRLAVQKFQCAKGVVCSGTEATTGYGMVGAKTRLAFGSGSVATNTSKTNLTRTIYIGARGADVVVLQNFLIAKGYLNAGSNSGYFGALTQTAVRKYQCAKSLACSGTEGTTGYGLVGAKTRAAINAEM